MRVGIVTESFLPQVNGVTNSVLRLMDHLRLRGHEAILLAPGNAATPKEYAGYPVTGLPSLSLPGYTQVRVSTTPSFSVERLLEDFSPDIVHLAAPFTLGYRGVLATARLQIPSVAIYQTEVPTYAGRYGVPHAESLLWRRVRETHSLATLTLAPSSFAKQQLIDHGVPRVKIWGRGVDSDRFHPVKRSPQWRKDHAPDGTVIIGYVGRLANEKQVDNLTVLQDIPGIKLVIVGDGPCRSDLEKKLPQAHFLGQLTGDKLATAYASFDIFITPGELETFCQTIQEAMASGVPVIAPRRGGPIDLIDVANTGYLYDPGDLAAMRQYTEKLVTDSQLRSNLGATARSRVAHKTWSFMCDQLLDHYRNTIRSSLPTIANQ
ncbi:MAG: glycosyltransferase family 4 protein [Propionibacteriaceae bacterium]